MEEIKEEYSPTAVTWKGPSNLRQLELRQDRWFDEMGVQENGNTEMGMSLGAKNKYRRMDSQVTHDDGFDDDYDASRHSHQLERRRTTRRYVFACSVFASLNNVLGYDVGVMSGAILFIQEDLKITEVQQEILVGILSVMSLLGSLGGGRTSDAIGRKWMGLAAIVFQAGAAVMTLAPSFEVLMIGRILAGVGIGFGVMIAPVYIAEISPTVSRGSLTSFPEIFINLGILLGYNRVDEARNVLLKTDENEAEVEERLAEIELAAGIGNSGKLEEKAVWRELLNPSPALSRMLITGFGIQCFQQITGIDATVYYSPEIFKAAGIVDNSKLLAATVAVGVTKTAFILTAIFLIDKVGRKPLLYVSTIGMTVCLFSLGSTLSFVGEGSVGVALAILSVCGNVAFFSVGIGPVCWVLTSEIFPLKVRAQASALGAVALSALSVAFVYKCVPETKGKSLEQIELLFQDGYELQGSEVQLGDVEHLVLKE
ncbi:UNVERIFIED_CONTAM: putative polyol transporter 4 [Sesamum angustifolium]|uniref:Polyol transporter 4 n=1 Tax=Sesamum angustifolium TaxID=2727405 RepID=A0AAW2IUZ0_9LAMI